MAVDWDQYVAVPDAVPAYRECRRLYGESFGKLRETIQYVASRTKPETVACLGAGLMNDIPYRFLVEQARTIHLVDWVPGIVESGVAMSTVRVDEAGRPECVYCSLTDERARSYCRHFGGVGGPSDGVCRNYQATDEAAEICEAFERSDLPIVEVGDVTAGFATAFGRGVNAELEAVRTWRQALKRGAALAGKLKRHRAALNIADSSVDLVTSSMVVSQFDHEPYDYFSKRAVDQLGAPTARDERALRSNVKFLRSALTREQVARHRDEIARLLAPQGVCFLAFELYHYDSGIERWFLVEEMLEALRAFAETFEFRFDLLPEADVLRAVASPMGQSLIHCVVLQGRQ